MIALNSLITLGIRDFFSLSNSTLEIGTYQLKKPYKIKKIKLIIKQNFWKFVPTNFDRLKKMDLGISGSYLSPNQQKITLVHLVDPFFSGDCPFNKLLVLLT